MNLLQMSQVWVSETLSIEFKQNSSENTFSVFIATLKHAITLTSKHTHTHTHTLTRHWLIKHVVSLCLKVIRKIGAFGTAQYCINI
jgi:hypothetical protein